MDQAEIDRIQARWIENRALGHCLHVGSGEKPIPWAVNIDPNPDRAAFVDHTYDVHKLPAYWTATFDSVVSNHVLQALRDPALALWEMARVLKPGYKMAHIVPDHRFAPLRRDARYPFQYMHNEWRGPEAFRPVIESLSDVLEVVTLESFEEFNWSFKVEAVRL
jgi:SAM-dependent methyltransferase